MKLHHAAWLALLPLLACEPELSGIEESRDLFEQLRDEHGGSYRYTSTQLLADNVNNCLWETTIEVQDYIVVSRDVVVTARYEDSNCAPSFSEFGESLGTSSDGAPAITIDEGYELCITNVIPGGDPYAGSHAGGGTQDAYHIGEDGILGSCGFRSADAGYSSYSNPWINIRDLTWLD